VLALFNSHTPPRTSNRVCFSLHEPSQGLRNTLSSGPVRPRLRHHHRRHVHTDDGEPDVSILRVLRKPIPTHSLWYCPPSRRCAKYEVLKDHNAVSCQERFWGAAHKLSTFGNRVTVPVRRAMFDQFGRVVCSFTVR
jgi:hypothetical protein